MTGAAAGIPKGLIPLLSATNFIIGMGAFVVIGGLTPLAGDLGLTPGEAGLLLTVYAIAYAILSPLLVALTGGIGRRRVLVAGLSLFTLSNLIAALAPDETLLLASRVLAAAGAGITTPITAAVVAALAPPDTRSKALAGVFFGITLAQVIGVPAGSFIAYTFGWRAAFWTVTALGLPMLALLWFRVPAGLSFQPVRLSDLGRTLRDAPAMIAVFFTATFLGAIYMLFTYFTPLMEAKMGFERNMVTASLVVFGVGAVVGNWMGGQMTTRLGPARTLLALSCAQAALMVPFSLLPLPLPLFVVLVALWSVCGWSFMAPQQTRLVTLSPQTAPVLLSLNAAAVYAGAAIGSAMGGVVIARFGIEALGLASGLMATLAIAHIVLSRRLSG